MIMSGWSDGRIVTWCDHELIRVQDAIGKEHYDLRKCEMPLWRRHQYVPIEKSTAPNSVKQEIIADLNYRLPKEPFFLISYVKSVWCSIKEVLGIT
jgi:hypothetical protein